MIRQVMEELGAAGWMVLAAHFVAPGLNSGCGVLGRAAAAMSVLPLTVGYTTGGVFSDGYSFGTSSRNGQ